MTLADRLVVMNNGQIEQVGPPAEVYHRPASRYVGGFLGSPPMNFLKGRIGDDGASVIVNDSQRLALAHSGLPAGQAVDVGIRPEEVGLLTPAGQQQLSLHLDFAEELGMGRLYHGRLGDEEFIVHATGEQPPALGQDVSIAVPESALHLFDPESGKRLADPTAAHPQLTATAA